MGEAADSLGYGWLWAVFLIAQVVTGGAVLRAAGRIFTGWGRVPEERQQHAGEQSEQPETRGGHDRVPAVMLIPAVALVGLGLFLGLAPQAREIALQAAAQFQDHSGYLARVLDGTRQNFAVPHAQEALSPAVLRGIVSAVLALLLAGLTLARYRLSQAMERAIAPLRRLDSGEIGDYVAWLTAGLAVFGALVAGLVR